MGETSRISTSNSDEFVEVRDLRNKQFFMVDDTYLNGFARVCGIYATGAYLCLCRHANAEQTCFPSVSLIAKKLGISAIQVKRALKVLEAHNIIKVERASGKHNVYYLLDKKHWSTTGISQIPVSNRHQTGISQILPPVSDRYPKETNRRKHIKVCSNSPDFERFWSLYPKRQGKKPALHAWNKINFSLHPVEQILSALERQKKSEAWTKDNGKYVPLPATWLNGERWLDEIDGIPAQEGIKFANL